MVVWYKMVWWCYWCKGLEIVVGLCGQWMRIIEVMNQWEWLNGDNDIGFQTGSICEQWLVFTGDLVTLGQWSGGKRASQETSMLPSFMPLIVIAMSSCYKWIQSLADLKISFIPLYEHSLIASMAFKSQKSPKQITSIRNGSIFVMTTYMDRLLLFWQQEAWVLS